MWWKEGVPKNNISKLSYDLSLKLCNKKRIIKLILEIGLVYEHKSVLLVLAVDIVIAIISPKTNTCGHEKPNVWQEGCVIPWCRNLLSMKAAGGIL